MYTMNRFQAAPIGVLAMGAFKGIDGRLVDPSQHFVETPAIRFLMERSATSGGTVSRTSEPECADFCIVRFN